MNPDPSAAPPGSALPPPPDVAPYLTRLFSLEGRTALVTGGSSGIGRAIAEALARAGASVVVVARREAELAATADALTALGCRAAWVSADLGDREALRSAVEEAAAVFGEPDILVNAAGINLRPPMGELTDEEWDTTMAVNLAAPFLLGRRFGPAMAERGHGRIIHISSQQAHRAFVRSGAYGVSKGGLESLARSQAEEWSPYGVTVNTLVPGFVLTPLNARLATDPEQVARLAARTMTGRNGLAEDFAGAAVFLASGASAYLTGQSVFVDGGLSVH
ncbi:MULTISPECIES: SDR family NAD(P)-dependent oxidoreductase [Streptomyces]|uniref:KR domain-containing protein n=1 Tax=Streptomyces tsukubensis (strain DSM 42081 / NBRC 108919 / NRRL 18488 / 9993) TaxID=1114943 RepID=I2N430_STRT9|nr:MULTISPECIES: SDR family oxidoreductase [Streptomyces]AZK95841.1 dehydrogenase [Streptomyces tsukubensis]EIF91777.1 short-chain dehydrogenase/reductase SDR [Streptomyces tsukubensis NRRL18488]MYS67566.1 SDR family oxidoreductase [Streptomyces sp. SID5473]QKM68137.1 KR domain-containing protein [Streptomyces tsukubensis NRRL18488]TAI44539.1 SDR family oxidoreductase [Streptomyces tsukubensis]